MKASGPATRCQIVALLPTTTRVFLPIVLIACAHEYGALRSAPTNVDLDVPKLPRDAGTGADVVAPAIAFEAPAAASIDAFHGGPSWSFTTPGMPRISRDGKSVYVAEPLSRELGAAPSLIVRTMAVADEQGINATALLTIEEFTEAGSAPDPAVAYAALARRVDDRAVSLNAVLTSPTWAPMAPCTIAEGPSSVYPFCSMDVQHIRCGELKITYAGQVLTIERDARKESVGRPRWKRAPYKSDIGKIPVRECIGEAYSDDRGALVIQLASHCQGGGDWCYVAPEWHVVQHGVLRAER